MANAVVMPKAGITVESCIIGEWQKKVGDQVAVGDILFTYETDKASFECESTAAGELIDIFFGNGEEVPCLTNVCVIGKRGEDYSALRPDGGQTSAESVPAAATPAAAEAAKVSCGAAEPAKAAKGISPRARKLAATAGVDAALATPTGPQGRIIERDVRKLMAEGVPAPAAVAAPKAAAPAPAASAPAAPAPEAEYEDVKFSNVRKVTAKGMMRSLSTMAQLTLHYSFDATQLQQYRKLLKEMDGPMARISLNDMILFAVSRALPSCPDLNANMIADDVVRRFKHVNLGFACDTPRGLLVPTIPNADQMSLLEISMAAKDLAAKAREGKISPDQLQGGTFSVTNLGATGCEMFTPVINPPQTGILGVCNIQTKIRSAKGGEIVTYPAMGLSITFDHRALDGAPVGRFMQELCKSLENFLTLLAK